MDRVALPTLSRSHQIAAWGVIAIGAALRFGAIGAGAPYRIANDEPFVVGMALKIMQTGDYNPHFFHYGGLSIYLHTVVAVGRFLYGALAGQWASVDQVWIGNFLTSARIVTAAIGTLTVFLVYRIGLRLGPAVALLAAFIMAVLPPHVRESHFALTDTPLTTLTTMVVLLSLRAAEQRRLAGVVTAAFVAGLAASVKYNGGLSLMMPLMAAFALPWGWRLRGMALAAAAAAAGFLMTSPYTVVDLRGFLNGFADLSSNYAGNRSFLHAAADYAKHLRGWFVWPDVMPLSVGYAVPAVSLAGGVLIALKRPSTLTSVGAAILIAFPVAWFAMLSAQGSLHYGRYLLPLSPMLCLGLAAALAAGWDRSAGFASGWRWSARILLLAALIIPSRTSINWVREHGRLQTAELAAAWLVREVPHETIVVEAASVLLPPSMKVHPVPRLVDHGVEHYKEQGLHYLVTTAAETGRYFGMPRTNASELAAFKLLLSQTEIVAAFLPSKETPGPGIRILRVRP